MVKEFMLAIEFVFACKLIVENKTWVNVSSRKNNSDTEDFSQ
jgi:hypothetical protein